MDAPINNEVALRVGLAAKQLDSIQTCELLQLLIDIMGEPITTSRLNNLRARTLRKTGGMLFDSTPDTCFEKAFALLKGRGVQKLLNSLPEFGDGDFCDIHGSLRVACASNSGETIDGEFVSCQRFLIYQVSPKFIRLIDIREPSIRRTDKYRHQLRANLLKDCSLLYTTTIGAVATAKVVTVGLYPIKILNGCSAMDELMRLQRVLSKDTPPPWLTKAMGKSSPVSKLYRGCVL